MYHSGDIVFNQTNSYVISAVDAETGQPVPNTYVDVIYNNSVLVTSELDNGKAVFDILPTHLGSVFFRIYAENYSDYYIIENIRLPLTNTTEEITTTTSENETKTTMATTGFVTAKESKRSDGAPLFTWAIIGIVVIIGIASAIVVFYSDSGIDEEEADDSSPETLEELTEEKGVEEPQYKGFEKALVKLEGEEYVEDSTLQDPNSSQ